MVEPHPVANNLVMGIFNYLSENLEAIFIATWLISLVVLIIVTLKLKWPNDKDWNSEEVLVYEKMMNREGLKNKTKEEIKELIVQEEVGKRALEDNKKKEKKKNNPKSINLQQSDKMKLSKSMLKSKFDKKLAKNLCGDPTKACKDAGKSGKAGKAVCNQLKCCVWAIEKNAKKGKCVEGSADEDGPTVTLAGQKWDHYYYLNKKYNKN